MTIKTINITQIKYHPEIELWQQEDGNILVRRGYNFFDAEGKALYPSWLYHDEAVAWQDIPVDIQNALAQIDTFIKIKIKEREGVDTNMVAPVITLIGDAEYTFGVNTEPIADPGATALDDIDGDITAQIRIGGSPVIWNIPGDYTITYDVTDSAGNDAVTVTRMVHIIE